MLRGGFSLPEIFATPAVGKVLVLSATASGRDYTEGCSSSQMETNCAKVDC